MKNSNCIMLYSWYLITQVNAVCPDMQSNSYLEPSISPIGAKLFICVAHPIWEHTFDNIYEQTHSSAVWHDDSNFFVCQVCHVKECPLLHEYDNHGGNLFSIVALYSSLCGNIMLLSLPRTSSQSLYVFSCELR